MSLKEVYRSRRLSFLDDSVKTSGQSRAKAVKLNQYTAKRTGLRTGRWNEAFFGRREPLESLEFFLDAGRSLQVTCFMWRKLMTSCMQSPLASQTLSTPKGYYGSTAYRSSNYGSPSISNVHHVSWQTKTRYP